ncbi:hypothetical protein K491DRAFT_283865 [Lophiostoma macrostomum CBS 122681]|uniref:MARVEL domain-containing protein n=1 Tax=Lophiostoma macrostomum CBS 122681 TaxID=1314788 RepID=A0A6A6TR05_9PLEO|nr:hypothetical protein K491DRAFT_283865 [Lophiostoma macrostomum CBS 122681]
MKIRPQPIARLAGDSRWAYISPLASYAPCVMLSLLVLSILQICLGAVWISRLEGDLSFPLVLQPLVLPCLSFFNTIPSLHLHLFTRTNNPLLALWFSSILAILYLAASLIDIVACSSSSSSSASSTSSLRAECPHTDPSGTGPRISQTFWNACVGLWMVSFAGYAIVAWMAFRVYLGFRAKERIVPVESRGGNGTHEQRRSHGQGQGGPMEDEEAGLAATDQQQPIRMRTIGDGKRVRDWEEEMLTEEQRQERLRIAQEKWRKVIM